MRLTPTITFEEPGVLADLRFEAYGSLSKLEGRDWATLRLSFHDDFPNAKNVLESYRVDGNAQGFLDGPGATGNFGGQISYSGTSLGPEAQCMSGQHDFALRQR